MLHRLDVNVKHVQGLGSLLVHCSLQGLQRGFIDGSVGC